MTPVRHLRRNQLNSGLCLRDTLVKTEPTHLGGVHQRIMLWILEFLFKSVDSKLDAITALLTKNHTEIMSKFSDFAAAQKAFNDRQGASIDGIVADVKALNDKITELQKSQGEVSPEDQALLDQLQQQGEALAARLESVDAQTPPVVPANPNA